MTMEEAIRHAEEKAKCGGRCGEEHAQLAEWLKELRERRTAESEKRTEERTKTHACDSISRRKAFEYFVTLWECIGTIMDRDEWEDVCMTTANEIPSAQPTLYGYEIEHLAYIARVMQKEGVTAEYAVRTFGDMSRALRMLIEELQEKVEKSLSAMQLSSVEPEIIRCKECLMHGVCRFEQGLGLDGYCSQAERRTE